MKRLFSVTMAFAAALAVGMAMAPPAMAAPCVSSQFIGNEIGSFFTQCPDAKPLVAITTTLGNAAINSGGFHITCEAGGTTTDQSGTCQAEAGSAGDGNVTVSFDYGGPNSTVNGTVVSGCPNPTGIFGTGTQLVMLTANDGSGVNLIQHFDIGSSSYVLDAAFPGGGQGLQGAGIACSNAGLHLASVSTAGGQTTICLNRTLPVVNNDCDATAAGAGFTCFLPDGVTPDNPIPPAPGRVFFQDGPCSPATGAARPDPRLNGWTPVTTTPGAPGTECFTAAAGAAGTCRFVGQSYNLGGTEVPAVTGLLSTPGPGASVNHITLDSVKAGKGTVIALFHTGSESGMVGFNIYAGGDKLNASLIPAKGTGDNPYTFEVGRGAIKGNKTLTVQGVLSDGSIVKSNPVTLQ